MPGTRKKRRQQEVTPFRGKRVPGRKEGRTSLTENGSLKKEVIGVFAAVCGFCILAYTVNNMVSFEQAMSTPTMFLILGMGEAWLRRRQISE